ncbi:MAG: thioredoxin-dependent thiol peroxidase [Mycobacteriales bacterium]
MTDDDDIRLQPGDVAPEFTLPNDSGGELSLKDLRGRKVVVYFYPAALTPGCTKEACGFRDNLDVFERAGYAVVGISPDKPGRLAMFRAAGKLNFPLLSDPDKDVLRAYGAYGAKKLYGREITGVIRSTFVINADGVIERAMYAVKATGHVDRVVRELKV